MLKNTLEETEGKNCLIEVYGLGYVGFPLSIKLAISGFQVMGIDVNQEKIMQLKQNHLSESELHLEKEFLECKKRGKILLSTKPKKTDKSKLGIICVPTPINSKDFNSNFFVKSAVEGFLESCKNGDVLILESSIEVGTTDQMKTFIETKGFKIGESFGLAFCPERIDPQNKKWNLENIPRVIYCSDDTTFRIAHEIYRFVNNSNLVRVKSAKIVEVVKSFENAFRLVNISLVNELALLCDKLGINILDVINTAASKPFGFMPFYTGAGAGGHCIPKDPTFLLESSKKFGLNFTTIENALRINLFMPEYIVDSIDKILSLKNLPKTVIVCGLSYKPDIEDMRDSPGFKVVNKFLKRNFEVSAYDPFYKPELQEKYLKENGLETLEFKIIPDLEINNIEKISCICVVQHHTKTKFRLEEIYKNSLVPVIYDCQHTINKNPDSKTILKFLGG